MNFESIKTNSTILVDAPRHRGRNHSENIERTTLNVPAETMERFERSSKGCKGICLAALIEFALDTLEKSGKTLVIGG